MKTTLEIDDELYREAKVHASLTGRKMKDLVTEGLRLAIRAGEKAAKPSTSSRKLAACFAEADKLMKAAPRGPTAREHLKREETGLSNHEGRGGGCECVDRWAGCRRFLF